MGLDVTAYSGRVVKPIPEHRRTIDEEGLPQGEWCGIGNHITAFVYAGFEQSLDGLVPGLCYEVPDWDERLPEDVFGFRAGSYSGYGEWRNDLARTILGVGEDDVHHEDEFRDKPFFELINFADNEGTVGPIAAGRLAQDFRDNRERYMAAHPPKVVAHAGAPLPGMPEEYDENEWFRAKYDDWQKAFELASDGGFVSFH